MECRDCHLWSHAGSRPLTWAAKEYKSGSERRRCQRRGNQNRVREEESERKRWWVNADSGETTREIKQATSAIGSLSHPFSSRSWLLFLQKKNSLALPPISASVSPFFIPPYESSPRLPLPKPKLQWLSLSTRLSPSSLKSTATADRPASSWPTDRLSDMGE